MVRHSSLAGLLLTLLASRCLAFEWKDCGGAGQGFSLEDVTLTPEPVAPGATAVFNIKATSGVLDCLMPVSAPESPSPGLSCMPAKPHSILLTLC